MNNLRYLFDITLGYIADVKQWCPIPLRANFNYTHDSGLGASCGTNSHLSVCPDWVTLRFNYSLCPTIQAFSSRPIIFLLFRDEIDMKLRDYLFRNQIKRVLNTKRSKRFYRNYFWFILQKKEWFSACTPLSKEIPTIHQCSTRDWWTRAASTDFLV